jgi:hypothetical protein
MLLFLHDLLNTGFDLLSPSFALPTPIDVEGHAGDDSHKVIHQFITRVTGENHLKVPSLRLKQGSYVNAGSAFPAQHITLD